MLHGLSWKEMTRQGSRIVLYDREMAELLHIMQYFQKKILTFVVYKGRIVDNKQGRLTCRADTL